MKDWSLTTSERIIESMDKGVGLILAFKEVAKQHHG